MTDPQRKLVTIILPAKNEEGGIGQTIDSLPVATLRALGLDAEILVLDGNSVDGTRTIAEAHGALVIPDREKGKGAALRNARPHFRGAYIVMLDADGTYASDAIPRLLAPLVRDEADIIMGDRVPLDGSMSVLHQLGNVMLSFGARLLYGNSCPDVCTGLWGFRAAALQSLPLQSRSFGLEAELFALASRLKLRIGHVDVDYLPRTGETKINFARDGLRIARRLLRSRLIPLPQPLPPAPIATPLPTPPEEVGA